MSINFYGFLTTEANNIVAPIHPKAMPVILATAEEYDAWQRAPWKSRRRRSGPLADGVLKIVAAAPRKIRPHEHIR